MRRTRMPSFIRERLPNHIRGCLIGGAAGDALGYTVEFMREPEIFARYGKRGIQEYELDPVSGKALISDDTQMTLFTAAGLLLYIRRRGLDEAQSASPSGYMRFTYQDWLRTQELSFEADKARREAGGRCDSWLCDVPELYHCRAPGNTCLSALRAQLDGTAMGSIEHPINHSKGCGGVMRVAPMGLIHYTDNNMEGRDRAGAEAAAITHGHALGYMPAAVLTHILYRIVFPEKETALSEIVSESIETVSREFAHDPHINELRELLLRAVELSENADSDLDNIHALGEGWVGDEALAIAIYCALRYWDDFSGGIIAAVNHNGDSDSTGAITGNILGAWKGLDGIESKWKTDLELYDVILTIADDLHEGEKVLDGGCREDSDWYRRYVHFHR